MKNREEKKTKTLYILHLSDSRKYIGMTSQKLHKRISRHKHNTSHPEIRQYTTLLYEAIRATGGFETVRVEEIMTVPNKYADIVERNFIRYYETTNPIYGLNSTDGGILGCKLIPEAEDRGKIRFSIEAYKYGTDEFVGKYPSLREASRKLGLHNGNVSRVLKGEYNHTGNYYFKLVPDTSIVKFIPKPETKEAFCSFRKGCIT